MFDKYPQNYALWPLYWLEDRIVAIRDMRLREDGTRDMEIFSKYSPVTSLLLIIFIVLGLKFLDSSVISMGVRLGYALGVVALYLIGMLCDFEHDTYRTEEVLHAEVIPLIQVQAVCLALIIWLIFRCFTG